MTSYLPTVHRVIRWTKSKVLYVDLLLTKCANRFSWEKPAVNISDIIHVVEHWVCKTLRTLVCIQVTAGHQLEYKLTFSPISYPSTNPQASGSPLNRMAKCPSRIKYNTMQKCIGILISWSVAEVGWVVSCHRGLYVSRLHIWWQPNSSVPIW